MNECLDPCAAEDCGDILPCSLISEWLANPPAGWKLYGKPATAASVLAVAEQAGYNPATGLARRAVERGGAVKTKDAEGQPHALYWEAVE